jgi:hypothetical protein
MSDITLYRAEFSDPEPDLFARAETASEPDCGTPRRSALPLDAAWDFRQLYLIGSRRPAVMAR